MNIYLVVVAGEIGSAVCGMRIDWMSLQKVLRSKSLSSGTFEAVNLKNLLAIASSGFLRGLVLPDAASDKDIKDQGDGTRQLVGSAVVALDIFVTDILVVMIEHSIGSLALWISVRGRFLDIDPVSAVYVVRQHTLLMVGNLVIKQQTLGTELDGGNIVTANVEQITLLKVSKLAILLWADEVRG